MKIETRRSNTTYTYNTPALPIALCNTHATRDTGNTRVSAKKVKIVTHATRDRYVHYLFITTSTY